MTETKEFPTAAIAGLSSGIVLCDFSEMYEAAEYLMGHPIWTHHFASKDLWQDMQKTVLAQHPNMPTSLPNVTNDNYMDTVERLEREFGKTVTIKKGSGETAKSPLEGIPDHLKDKTIMVEV